MVGLCFRWSVGGAVLAEQRGDLIYLLGFPAPLRHIERLGTVRFYVFLKVYYRSLYFLVSFLPSFLPSFPSFLPSPPHEFVAVVVPSCGVVLCCVVLCRAVWHLFGPECAVEGKFK